LQQERENYYLQKYLPLLNSIIKSSLSETESCLSLYEILKHTQSNLNLEGNKYAGIKIFLYEFSNSKFSIKFKTFSSINKLSKNLKIARETIKLYINTNVPFKNYLFFTYKIVDFDLIKKLISDATQGLILTPNLAKKV
jgi:hypothetical protein